MAGTEFGAGEIRALARELDLRPTKALGQNFVIDPGTTAKIVRHAGVEPGDRVLEIGPGLGSLTLALLEAGADVTALEIDGRLAARLPRTVGERGYDRLRVIEGDALKLTAEQIGEAPTKLVANLPYNVAVPAILRALEELETLTVVDVMVQKEVADRLAAEPGSRTYGVPSLKAAWYGEVSRGPLIPRTVFWPVPNVDSALVRIDRRPAPGEDRPACFEIIDAAFSQRRKTLRQSLSRWAGSPARAEEILRAAGIDPKERAERLTIADVCAIARCA